MPPIRNDRGLILNTENQDLRDQPSDILPPRDRGDNYSIDRDFLQTELLQTFQDDIADKNQMGFLDIQDYGMRAYYGLKNKALMNWPWKGASAFPVPLTPTMVDTIVANIHASKWNNPMGPIKVGGVGEEDIRTSKNLAAVMNWVVVHDIDYESEDEKNTFRTYLKGTAVRKVFQDIMTNGVKVYSLDIDYIFLPLDARGMQRGDTPRVTHIIPLQKHDLALRKAMNIYEFPDDIQPGVGIMSSQDADRSMQVMDQVSGTGMSQKSRRDNYYIAETHMTHVPKGAYKPQELIVWWTPSTGRIQRVRVNKENAPRPFADSHAYPYGDRFFSQSVPEKIRNEQEEMDYSTKQNTDALDRAISPAAFVDDTDSFDRNVAQRVPGGIYPKGKGNTIDYEPTPPVERGFERRAALLWEQAERKLGISDVTQGVSNPRGDQTLGEVQLATASSGVRFKSLFRRAERGDKKVFNLLYHYIDRYMPRNKKIKVLGYSDFKTIDELFPKTAGQGIGIGLGIANVDFALSGTVISELEDERRKTIEFCDKEMSSPHVVNDRANWYRMFIRKAEAYGIRDAENLVTKPPEAYVLSVEEFIQRVMSGEVDVQVRPGIDNERYLFEIQLFMRTEAFKILDEMQKKTLVDALRRADQMAMAERQEKIDLMVIQQRQQAMSAMPQEGQDPEQGEAVA